jgi:hypothetical protein
MLPILLMMWAGSQDATRGDAGPGAADSPSLIFFTAFALLHVAVFLAAIAWLAGAVTRVEAASRDARAGSAARAALQSLAASGVPIDVTAGDAPGEWTVALRLADADRTHRVLLQIDETHAHRSRARAPRCQRRHAPHCRRGEHAQHRRRRDRSDPARCPARLVAVAQTSMIDPARPAGHAPRPARRPRRTGADDIGARERGPRRARHPADARW